MSLSDYEDEEETRDTAMSTTTIVARELDGTLLLILPPVRLLSLYRYSVVKFHTIDEPVNARDISYSNNIADYNTIV